MNSFKTIGIIGGGQLGQMMAIAAIYMATRSLRWIQLATALPPALARGLWHLTMMLRLWEH